MGTASSSRQADLQRGWFSCRLASNIILTVSFCSRCAVACGVSGGPLLLRHCWIGSVLAFGIDSLPSSNPDVGTAAHVLGRRLVTFGDTPSHLVDVFLQVKLAFPQLWELEQR